ncbi:glycosyltransferase family 2 protein [Dialister hominis]|uniref:glycosyltransferase family 2 protein n=1 Tax=Dialister hominis TaxID=2582419 RepID=UPI003FF081BC
MSKISVIVPVYNVAPYLKKCVDSIINQTFTDIEIILVDDGSTDESGTICDQYAQKDSRVKVIHKSNGGLSDARNSGLEVCSGEYIGFVDSDDWISPDMYETLIHFAVKEDLDVAMCGVSDIWPDRIEGTPHFKPVILTDVNDIISEILVNKHGGTCIPVWNRIYRSRIFKDLKFEKGRYYEDGYYLLRWIERTKRFGRISDRKYFYLHREGSITDVSKHNKRIDDFQKAYEDNFNYIKKHFPGSIKAGEYRLFFTYRAILNMIGKSDLSYSEKIVSIFRANLFSIWKNQYIRFKLKLIYTLIGIHVSWYYALRHIYRRV